MIYATVSALCPGSLSYLGWWRVNQLGAPLLVAGGWWLVAGGWWTGDTPAHTPSLPLFPFPWSLEVDGCHRHTTSHNFTAHLNLRYLTKEHLMYSDS